MSNEDFEGKGNPKSPLPMGITRGTGAGRRVGLGITKSSSAYVILWCGCDDFRGVSLSRITYNSGRLRLQLASRWPVLLGKSPLGLKGHLSLPQGSVVQGKRGREAL